MKIVTTVAEVPPKKSRRVLVPTMGALHRAHGELMRVAREHGDEVVVSIFVNPLQFEPGSDFERYPRPEKEDEEFCRKYDVDLLFRPAPSEMYLDDRSTFVDETALAQTLEGKSRPGHFRGVCTVVAKLFNILQPDVAVFGEKDFQQLAIIRRMVRDMSYKIDIVAVPTVREDDGLAFSSRNRYLNEEERKQAPIIRKALLAGDVDLARKMISEAPLARIDYVELVDAETLQPIKSVKPNSLIAAAVFFGKTRLIDNIHVT
jgi:pantoate--beta-alanine ligase